MPVWLKEKLYLQARDSSANSRRSADGKLDELPPLLFTEHHQSHAACAFFPCPFEERPCSASTASANGRRRRSGSARAIA